MYIMTQGNTEMKYNELMMHMQHSQHYPSEVGWLSRCYLITGTRCYVNNSSYGMVDTRDVKTMMISVTTL